VLMSGRELVILLIGFAAVTLLLRGLYIALQARRGLIKLAIDKNIPQDVNLDELEMAELPGGGARVVERSLNLVNQQNSALSAAGARAETIGLGRLSANQTDEEQRSIPVLMDAVELADRDDDLLVDANITEGVLDSEGVEETDKDAESILLDYGKGKSSFKTPEATDADVYESLQSIAPNNRDEDDLGGISGDISVDNFEKNSFKEETRVENSNNEFDDSGGEFDESQEEFGDQSANIQIQQEKLEGDINQLQETESPYGEFDDLNEEVDEELNEEFSDERREEPTLGSVSNFEDDLDDFSMTAGERIGFESTPTPASEPNIVSANDEIVLPTAESDSTPVTNDGRSISELPSDAFPDEEIQDFEEEQVSLFDDYQEDEERESEEQLNRSTIGSWRQSLFSAFNRKPEVKSAAAEEPIPVKEETQSEGPQQQLVDDSPGQNELDIHPSEVIVLNVMAREGYQFAGDDLLQVLITSGLKFGEMNIFHHRKGNGPVIFSVANILNPGTFDLNSMEEFSTLGVSFFLALPTAINNLDALEQMLRVAQQIRGALDGDLRDDNRNLMTAQTTEHYRQRVRDFELRRLKAANNRS
jgi:cell division protein ZipA